MISLKTNLPLRILLPTIYHDDSVLQKRLQMQSQANFFDNLRQSLDQKSFYGNFRVQLDVLLSDVSFSLVSAISRDACKGHYLLYI